MGKGPANDQLVLIIMFSSLSCTISTIYSIHVISIKASGFMCPTKQMIKKLIFEKSSYNKQYISIQMAPGNSVSILFCLFIILMGF